MSQGHRSWLENEAALIIGSAERDYFLSLRGEKERDAFIEAFWLAHDPTPGTIRNEFREEHQRRLAEVSRRFGNMLWPGTSTARGKVYLRLGEPVQIARYESPELTSNLEAWLYPPDLGAGIKYNFYVLFYRPESKGDLEPFCPGEDEPAQLLAMPNGRKGEAGQEEAVHRLLEIDPLLGQLSLSLLPSEHRPIMANNSFDLRKALARRNNHAKKILETLLGKGGFGREQLTRIKAIMRGEDAPPKVRYTSARADMPIQFNVLRGENGQPRLFYSIAIDGKRLAVADSHGRCYTVLEVELRVLSQSGDLVNRKVEMISAALDPWIAHNGSPGDLLYQGVFDLRSGEYRVEAEVRSPLDGVQYSFGDRIVVPPVPLNRLQLSNPILLLNDIRVENDDQGNPYTLFGERLIPAIEQYVEKGQNASFYYQLFFPRRDRTSSVRVRYILRSGGEVYWQEEERLYDTSLHQGGFFSQKVRVPCADFPAGIYTLEIVATALSPPEARVSTEFVVQGTFSTHGVPTLASIEQKGQ